MMAECKKCLSEKVCRYNDGINLYCKEDYECPHFTPTAGVVEVKWTNVDEKLPEKADWYLVYAENQRPFVAYFKGKTFPLNNHYHKITHWMPLPEPPKEGDDNGL